MGPAELSQATKPCDSFHAFTTICFPKELSPIHLIAYNIIYLTTGSTILIIVKEKTKK
jgi:hypothetical protein